MPTYVRMSAPDMPLSLEASLRIGREMTGHSGTFFKTPNIPYEVWSAKSKDNDVLALKRRLLRAVPEIFIPADFVQAKQYLLNRARQLEPMTRIQLLDCYSGAKRNRYRLAMENLDMSPLEKRHFEIASFVKRERFDDYQKYPRMVHHREYEAIFEMLRYIKPLEHFLYKKKIRVNSFQSIGTNVAKGMNGNERYEAIYNKFNNFDRCEVLSLDCSSFELHTSYEYLEYENEIMESHYKNDKYFRWICSNLLDNKGRTQNGVKWARRGGRVSGDAHTGFGNTMFMLLVMIQYAYDHPNFKFDVLSDGDDTLMFYEQGTLQAEDIISHFARAGHELRVDGIARAIEDIIFCQHRFIEGCMVRDPKEILEKSLVVVNSLTEVSPRDYFAGVGKGLLAVYGVIPEMVPIFTKMANLNPESPITNQYWLKHPQVGKLPPGRIFDLFGSDCSSAIEEAENLVSYLQQGE